MKKIGKKLFAVLLTSVMLLGGFGQQGVMSVLADEVAPSSESTILQETGTKYTAEAETSAIADKETNGSKVSDVIYNTESIISERSDGGVKVSVNAPAGTFPEGTTVVITTVKISDSNVIFEITFTDKDGNKVQPSNGNEVSVNFTVSKSSALIADNDTTNLEVYHINDDGSEEKTGIASTGGADVSISTKADHFSKFSVRSKKAPTNSDQNDNDPKDIGEYVAQKGITVSLISGSTNIPIVKDGVAIENAPSIKVGDQIKLTYKGDITADNMKNVSAGDFFEIKLPDTQYISTIEGAYNLKNEDGDIYATYTIINGILKVVLTEVGASQIDIEDWWIEVTGNAIKEGKNVALTADGNVTISINPGTGGSGGGGNDEGKAEITDKEVKFTKDGHQYSGKDIINWHLNVNYDGLRQMISKEAVDIKKNVILVDTLPDNVDVDMGSIYITTPLFVPTPEGKMSGYSIGYMRITPDILYKEDAETYETFYQRIKNHTKPSVGIFENKILFGFGNLPGNGLSYADVYNKLYGQSFDSFVDKNVSNGNISEAQGVLMKEVYSSDGTAGGQIIGYDVSYDTNVSGDSGDYKNEAKLLWDEGGEDDTNVVVAFNETSGGASSVKTRVKVKKEWEDDNNSSNTRPQAVKVQLFADGEAKGEPAELNSNGSWSYE